MVFPGRVRIQKAVISRSCNDEPSSTLAGAAS